MIGTLLGEHSPHQFVNQYWQKKPRVIRQGMPGFESPVTPDELAGLSCEPHVHARLILERGGQYPWELREGPFDPDAFRELPESHWTLLVQEVDRLIPEVHDLLEAVRFLPRWRIDDIMISYAPEYGSVGAHVDNYDVFLLQGHGQRRWEIESNPRAPEYESGIEGRDVRMLSEFEPDRSWILEPGDILYLPPRIPHHGVALTDCMTYSIGFRAPTHREMILGYLEHLVDAVDDDRHYSDPEIDPRERPGQIRTDDFERVYGILDRLLGDRTEMQQWFGRAVTRSVRGGSSVPPASSIDGKELSDRVAAGEVLRRSEASRFAYTEDAGGRSLLFVDGAVHEPDPAWAGIAAVVANLPAFTADDLRPHITQDACADLLAVLYNEGQLYFP